MDSMQNKILNKMTNSQNVLDYLNHLKNIKKSIGPNYTYFEDEGLFTILDKENIPKISLSKKLFDIFQELD